MASDQKFSILIGTDGDVSSFSKPEKIDENNGVKKSIGFILYI